MCANYTPSKPEKLEKYFFAGAPESSYKGEAYPGSMAPFIRRPSADHAYGQRASALGMFGMVPHWAEMKLSRQTYNARTETVGSKPSFRNAFKKGQFCIIPADAIYEPSYEAERPVRFKIERTDGEPLGIAGIWEHRDDGPKGLPLLSFSMLTINADDHPLMRRFHKPTDEKRMVVLLQPEQFDDWLNCPADDAPEFFQQFPADELTAHAEPKAASQSSQSSQGSLLDE